MRDTTPYIQSESGEHWDSAVDANFSSTLVIFGVLELACDDA
jgi:hypothetical protein